MSVTITNFSGPLPTPTDLANYEVNSIRYMEELPGVIDAQNAQNDENNTLNANVNLKHGEVMGAAAAVAANATNINAVAANEADIDTVATNIANVNAVAANEANINAVAANATNINAVASNAANIDAVGANIGNVNAVAANEANINAVAANAANINAAVANLPDLADKVSKTGSDMSGPLAIRVESTSVGTASYAGTFKVGDTGVNTAAVMSFHRTGYGINFGLDSDNVFRLGGWSQGAGTYRLASNAAGDLVALGNVSGYSDARLKTDLTRITDALEKVQELTGYTYTRIDTLQRQTGLLAQDVQRVLPEAVDDSGEHLTLAYGNLMGLMVEAVKELTERVKRLEGVV